MRHMNAEFSGNGGEICETTNMKELQGRQIILHNYLYERFGLMIFFSGLIIV